MWDRSVHPVARNSNQISRKPPDDEHRSASAGRARRVVRARCCFLYPVPVKKYGEKPRLVAVGHRDIGSLGSGNFRLKNSANVERVKLRGKRVNFSLNVSVRWRGRISSASLHRSSPPLIKKEGSRRRKEFHPLHSSRSRSGQLGRRICKQQFIERTNEAHAASPVYSPARAE